MPAATNIKIKRDDDRWEIEIQAEIPAPALTAWRAKTLAELARDTVIDGFRPGHAPEALVLARYGEAAVLERAASAAVRHELPEILAKENANIVDAPKVAIEPLAPGKPAAFVATAPLAPKVMLADYKQIAAETNTAKTEQHVTDEEHAQALTHLKRERARIERLESGNEPRAAAEHAKAMEEKDLPALDDAFAQSVGYDDAKAFEAAVRANIKNEKDLHEAEKRRAAMLDELVKKSDIKYPAVLKEYELDEMEARLAGDLERMGTTLDAYLAQSKKTKDDVRKEWESAADKRARVRLILGEIARAEKIEPDPETLAHELEHAKKNYPNANEETLRAHIAHAMRNEQVIRFLESVGA